MDIGPVSSGAAPHLGGYVPGGDAATWYPALWKWLAETVKIRTFLDVGCGDGVAVDFLGALDVLAVGIDGVPQPNAMIVEHDFTLGPFGREEASAAFGVAEFDVCWCCEFVEHVDERYVENFVATLKLAETVLLTHATPGQQGHHHVNCQPPAYWVSVMVAAGFSYHQVLTDETRKLCAVNTSPWNHYARSGMAFVR